MSEDDPLKPWKDRIASGEPLMIMLVEPPIRLSILQDGAIQIDSPMGLLGIEQAGIQRVILAVSPDTLRAALAEIENKGLASIELTRSLLGQQ